MQTFLRLIHRRYQHALHATQAPPFSLQYWRERILGVIYFSVALLGCVAYLPSVYLSIREEIWWLASFNTLGYAWFLLAAFTARISFKIKAAGMLVFIYTLGVALIFRLGPFAAGPIWLFLFPIMAGLLFGLQTALRSLVLNAVTVFGFGFLIAEGFHAMDFIPPNMVVNWWVFCRIKLLPEIYIKYFNTF